MAYTTINKSSDHFNTKLYTGNGSTQSITGVGFQPDMTWGKARSTTTNHVIQTPVQGLSTAIFPNLTNAESTGLTNAITSFDTDGFSLGDWSPLNASGQTFASWNWKASNATAVSNTDGSITSTVSANTISGFSIVSWVGNSSASTVGHGLGSVPKMIIVKNRTDAEDWVVYHGANTSAPETDYLVLNLTNATGDSSGVWNDTAPTSSVFSVGTANSTNGSSDNMIAYCFTPIRGFSAMGSYVGVNSNQFIYLGFKPAMVIIKNTSITENWSIYDNKRLGYNPAHNRLYPNLTNAEATETKIDFVSNGMMLRSAGDGHLTGGTNTFVYCAFAEAPLVGSNNVPCTAK